MLIIARRIPYGLGNYHTSTVRAYTVRGGMGGAESCGPTQQWDPNYVYDGIKGQCTPKGSALAPKPSTDWGALATSLFSGLVPKSSTPKYVQGPPGYSAPAAAAAAAAAAPPAPSGMSSSTMLAIGLGAAGLLAIVMLTRK